MVDSKEFNIFVMMEEKIEKIEKGKWIKIGEHEGYFIEMFVIDKPSIWNYQKDITLKIIEPINRK